MKKIILASILAAAVSGAILPAAQAQVSVNINIGTPPPPPRVERLPPPRHGYVWVPGYWDWNGHAHVWRGGRWVRERRGYVYAQPAWREGPRGWELDRGGWRGGPPPRPAPPPPPPRYDDHGPRHGHGPDHCPPGHARKGECW
ncbi:YXWGXW repeat-containing protein [Herbaspirillum robiniae]|uniref:BcpO-related WXXGXW repeat protein n=1 Tax=Herbaspirillum robiniae TaxID=2014887 RepID=A0ABX2M5F1_9BURK|nr:YXWGXW repeat-containing protein [Herbaspirillum robiniae]NUU03492.1 BcpO-related WXXGXW repeat protein [Herbaspirillum robiniae]